MGKALLVLILTVGILLGGFYLFFYQNEATVLVNEESASTENLANDALNEAENNEVSATLDTSNWLDYQYMTKRLVFTTKYPATGWQTVEQEHEDEFNLIFTNGDSCQVVYSFELEAEAYNFDLANNNQEDECVKILQKIIAYASVPKFGIAAASLVSEEPEEPEGTEESEGTELTEEPEEENQVNQDDDNQEETDDNQAEKNEADDTVIETSNPSAGVTDQEIMEMSSEDRYDMVKEFVHEYLTEFAKRHWDYVESKLSAKAKKELGSGTLANVVNTYYYYEVLNFINEVSETQYTTTVKLTDKEEEPIGDGSGVYKLNIVWENGEWKIDNYLFE